MKIFIAHKGEDSLKAIEIRELLKTRLQLNDDDFFISSDSKSIETGSSWFPDIIENLNNSSVIIALLTAEWESKPWIPFEAGYGYGRGAKLYPVVFEDSLKTDNKTPFYHLQAKNLSVESELERFLEEVRFSIEGDVNQPKVIPFLNGSIQSPMLKFYITNPSNRRFKVAQVQVDIPKDILHTNHIFVPDPNIIKITDNVVDGVAYRTLRYTGDSQLNPYYQTNPLLKTLNPNESRILLDPLRLLMNTEVITKRADQLRIMTRLDVEGLMPIVKTFAFSDIERSF